MPNSPIPFKGLLVAPLLVALLLTTHARGQTNLRQETSLKFVSSDVSIYSTMLRNREQWEKFAASKAFAAIKQMPLVQLGLAQARTQWEDDPSAAAFRNWFEADENQDLLRLGVDAVSDEVFFVGGAGFADLLSLANEINSITNRAQIQGANEEELAEEIFRVLAENRDRVRVPQMLIGFRLRDPALATAQLDRLEALLRGVFAAQAPQLAERISRRKIGEGEYLTLELDGEMIPWGELPLDDVELPPDVLDKLIAHIKRSKVTISIGVHDRYALISIADTNQQLEDLDKNRDLLIDSKYLAPLRADAEKQILGVSYVSEKFVREANSTNRQLDDAAEMIGLAVAEIDAPPPLQAEIKKDVQTLFDGFKSLIPEPGAAASYSYFSERGIEGISHNWSENKTLDASQELSLLNHVGGSPIFFAVGRSKPVDGWYDALVHAGKRGLYYFEQFAESELSNDERQILALAKEKATPLLKRLDAANREQWGPGLSDEGGLVFDATQLDGPIHPAVPPVDAPLLLPELAIIHGVADKEKIKTGINEYWAVLKAAWNEVKAVAEGEVPPIEVPDLQVTKANGGELFQIPLGQLGVGEAIGPNAAVSDDVLVLSLSPLTGQRLLKPGAARTGGPLLRESRALGAASHFNWAKFVDTLVSWTEYGLAVGAEVDPDGEEVFEQYKVFRPQIEPVVNVLKCFRSATAVTYTSDGATVTHYELHFRDLE